MGIKAGNSSGQTSETLGEHLGKIENDLWNHAYFLDLEKSFRKVVSSPLYERVRPRLVACHYLDIAFASYAT